MRRGVRWGPGGSVGFEIVTGEPTTTVSSDLDLILRQDDRLELNDAIELLQALTSAAGPARIDVVLETPNGGVLLADLARMQGQILVRTPHGPRLLYRSVVCGIDRIDTGGIMTVAFVFPGKAVRVPGCCISFQSIQKLLGHFMKRGIGSDRISTVSILPKHCVLDRLQSS